MLCPICSGHATHAGLGSGECSVCGSVFKVVIANQHAIERREMRRAAYLALEEEFGALSLSGQDRP